VYNGGKQAHLLDVQIMTETLTFSAQIKTLQAKVDKALSAYLQPRVAPQLWEAMSYSVLNGGKRIRPLLLLLSCEALGQSSEAALPAACALELIHSYSLIHDDLPALDNDDWRRGQPSNHKQFNEALAILSGDALSSYAFELLSSPSTLPAAIQLQILHEIATASGPSGMCAGQVLDMFGEISAEQKLAGISQIYQLKTGCLIRSAVRCGAWIGGAQPEQMNALTRYAEALGLAFQIQDDILDLTGSLDSLGKTPQKDLEQDKRTWPWAVGLEAAIQQAHDYLQIALEALHAAQLKEPQFLEAMALYLVERQA
jgi:geranylgeranyl diphosphate synthase, type II